MHCFSVKAICGWNGISDTKTVQQWQKANQMMMNLLKLLRRYQRS